MTSYSWTVNCSTLLTNLPLLDRPAAARAAGFEAIELWWPFDAVVPDPDLVESLISALNKAGVQLTGLNFAAGNMAGGDRGLVSWPERAGDWRANLDAVTAIGERTGCRLFNALYGLRQAGATPEEQDQLGRQNLALAARAVGRIGGTVLLEPVSGAPTYPVKTAAQAIAILDTVLDEYGTSNCGLLLDVYHLAANGDDVSAAISAYSGRTAHVQIADFPGRGAPGSGDQPI
jgi:hydroxypyruvate isomerase